MRASREDLKVETTSDEMTQRKDKLQSLVEAQKQIVDTNEAKYTRWVFGNMVIIEKQHSISYRAFPPTKKNKNNFVYKGAGLTLFSIGRQEDRISVIEDSLSRDKKSWVDNQTNVMDEMRKRFK